MDTTDATPATRQVGTLTLTVRPDTPLGEHQRYAYRIEDTTSGQSLEGRDLFTGAGASVASGKAMQDLAGYLTAAVEARQYVLDNPGSTPEHQGMFPRWVAEAARRNADELIALTEGAPATHDNVPRRRISVVFLQGAEADDVLDLIDRDGPDAAIEHLAGFDYGEDTTQDALENGYVYDQLPTGAADRVATRDVYTLSYNHAFGYVGLLREFNALPDPALLGIETMTPAPTHSAPAANRTAPDRAGTDWFAAPTTTSAAQASRGRSL